jgi:hypothetical protein
LENAENDQAFELSPALIRTVTSLVFSRITLGVTWSS